MAAPAEVRIVLLGKTGSGKSSAGNVILEEEKFDVSSDPISVTIDCQTEEVNINGWKFTVTDTPGIFDPMRSEKDLKYSIISCLTECAPGPHAFILVLKVGRYTKEEEESVRKILKWFGKEALKYTVVLFTHGDELKENQTIEEYVKKNKDLKELIDKCEGRVHVIDSKWWNKNKDKNAQSADLLLEQLNKMMVEKREAGESQAVQTLEVLKNQVLQQRSSAPDQEGRATSSDGNPDGSEYRSNSFQIKQLLTTIENMVRDNRGSHYTNKPLQVISDAIEMEVKNIKEQMEEGGEKAEESEIKRRARERVRTKTLRLAAGVTTGVLLGALLGVAVGLSLPGILAAGLLVGAVARGYGKLAVEATGAACRRAVVAGALGAGAAGAAVAEVGAVGALGAAGAASAEAGAVGALGAAGATSGEAGAVGALGAAGAAAGIGVAVAVGVLASAGAIGGGVEGAKAAARADKPKEAAENAAEAVVEKAGNMIKEAWDLGQRVTKAKETPYKKLQ